MSTTIDKLRELEPYVSLRSKQTEFNSLCDQVEAELKKVEKDRSHLMNVHIKLCERIEVVKKENNELKKQVEAMKCCGNCEYLICTGCTLDRYNCEINDRKYWKLKGGAK